MSFSLTCPTCGLELVMQSQAEDMRLYACLNAHWWETDSTDAWRAVEAPAPVEVGIEPWVPQNMAGLLGLYLPKTLQFTLAHNEKVLAWPDSGPYGNTADGTITGFQDAPTWDASEGAVRFVDNGATPWNRLDIPIPSDTDNQAFVLTFKAASEKSMYLLAGGNGSTSGRRVRLVAGSTDDARLYRGSTVLYDSPAIPDTLWDFARPFILSGYITADSYMLGINGSYVTGSHAVASAAIASTRVGKVSNNSDVADGWLYALAFFINPLYLVDLQAMEGWMAHQFGVTLAEGHPYRDVPPAKTATGVAKLPGITL